jgi:proline iminopeptidase
MVLCLSHSTQAQSRNQVAYLGGRVAVERLAVCLLAQASSSMAAMTKRMNLVVLVTLLLVSASVAQMNRNALTPTIGASNVYPLRDGFVDVNGVMIYYKILGKGKPLVVVHGGPGASHDYFLPYLLPLARHNRLIFIDERGSGRSQKLEDAKGYTVENMVEDVEAIRKSLGLGKISLLGHSYGGALAQAYALKYQQNLTHLILGSTWSSTEGLNQVFVKMKEKMTPELRARIDKMEEEGLFGHGKPYEQNRYTEAYMIAAWGEGYFPYLYHNRLDANYDPVANGIMSWDLYREMWGSHGEFIIDGNLKSVEYTERLSSIKVPTLIVVGEHDESDPALSQVMHEKIAGSKLAIMPNSGHMTFVDQPERFIRTVDEFLNAALQKH